MTASTTTTTTTTHIYTIITIKRSLYTIINPAGNRIMEPTSDYTLVWEHREYLERVYREIADSMRSRS